MQGLAIWSIQNSYELAKLLGKENDVSSWLSLIKKMKEAARACFYNKQTGLVESGPEKQISYLSQVWMVLSGTLTQKEGRRALNSVMAMPEACYPGSPYAYHYVLEALLKCNMNKEARSLLLNYWGNMVEKLR